MEHMQIGAGRSKATVTAVPAAPRLGAGLAALGIALAASGARAQIYVDDDAPPGGDGRSWQTAFRSVQQGLDALGGATRWTVHIAEGTYIPPGGWLGPNSGFHADITNVASGTVVVIRGGFAGLANPAAPDTYDPGAYVTLLDGDTAQNDESGDPENWWDNSTHVLQVGSRAAIELHVSGVVITRGRALKTPYLDALPLGRAGGLRVMGPVSLILKDCALVRNSAICGGALCASEGSIIATNCLFAENRAELGGAIAMLGPRRVSLAECVLRANHATYGGAVAIAGSPVPRWQLSLSTCLLDSNSAADLGGAVFSSSGHVTLGACTLWNNHDRIGGSVFVQGGFFASRGSIIWAETADPPVQLVGNLFVPVLAQASHSLIAGGQAGLVRSAEGVVVQTYRIASGDPLIADPIGPDGIPASGDEDFNPTTNSPAVNRGDHDLPWPYVDHDLDGDPRIIGRIDIGAYELKCLADLTAVSEGPSPGFGTPDGQVNAEDYYYFLDAFERGDLRVDFSGSTDPSDPRYTRPDGIVDMTDFFRFLDDFANPCYP